MTKYRLNLTNYERQVLKEMISKGHRRATHIVKANILLAFDETIERQSEASISQTYYSSVRTVERIGRQFCEKGMAILRQRSVSSETI